MAAGQRYDTLVIGGGVIGAATALALAAGGDGRPPRRTLLLEADEPAHARGSSHGDGRIVRYTYGERQYLELARRAIPAWSRIARDAGVELLVPTGSWECGPSGCHALDQIAAGLELAELPFERLDATSSRRRFPQLALDQGSQALYQADGSVIRADQAVKALWRLAAAAGAEMCRHTPVHGVVPRADHLRVEAGGKILEASTVVVAAGAWAGPLLARLGCTLPLEVRREAVAYFPPRPGAEDHRAGYLPAIIDYHTDPPFYALPQLRVPAVKAGWHHTGLLADPDQHEEGADITPIRKWITRRLPQLDVETPRVTTCLYTNTPDYHFIVDRLPAEPRVAVAAGFSGHGFKFAPAIGEAAAELAAGGTPAVDLGLFSIDRFAGARPLSRRILA